MLEPGLLTIERYCEVGFKRSQRTKESNHATRTQKEVTSRWMNASEGERVVKEDRMELMPLELVNQGGQLGWCAVCRHAACSGNGWRGGV